VKNLLEPHLVLADKKLQQLKKAVAGSDPSPKSNRQADESGKKASVPTPTLNIKANKESEKRENPVVIPRKKAGGDRTKGIGPSLSSLVSKCKVDLDSTAVPKKITKKPVSVAGQGMPNSGNEVQDASKASRCENQLGSSKLASQSYNRPSEREMIGLNSSLQTGLVSRGVWHTNKARTGWGNLEDVVEALKKNTADKFRGHAVSVDSTGNNASDRAHVGLNSSLRTGQFGQSAWHASRCATGWGNAQDIVTSLVSRANDKPAATTVAHESPPLGTDGIAKTHGPVSAWKEHNGKPPASLLPAERLCRSDQSGISYDRERDGVHSNRNASERDQIVDQDHSRARTESGVDHTGRPLSEHATSKSSLDRTRERGFENHRMQPRSEPYPGSDQRSASRASDSGVLHRSGQYDYRSDRVTESDWPWEVRLRDRLPPQDYYPHRSPSPVERVAKGDIDRGMSRDHLDAPNEMHAQHRSGQHTLEGRSHEWQGRDNLMQMPDPNREGGRQYDASAPPMGRGLRNTVPAWMTRTK
jgi:hypothetical protein